MKAYYAHSMHLYGSKQEERDISTIQSLGFTVVNPADQIHQARGASAMTYFRQLVRTCQVLIFRALPDGKIGSGVAAEIAQARADNIPVLELPWGETRRVLSVEDTRSYLGELGER